MAGKSIENEISSSNLPLTDINNKSSKDIDDSESEKGHFGWEQIGTCYVPFILRKINGEIVHYVSVRIAEAQLLIKYLHFLHEDVFSCMCVKSHFITENEAKLLNDINVNHSDQLYRKYQFHAGKDYIVRLEDLKELYEFLDVCYQKLVCCNFLGQKKKCGFIRINLESVVPYCIKDNENYVPLFYFDGEMDNIKQTVKLENVHLAYLKFCCKVQGIRSELIPSDYCIVTNLENIKEYFSSDTKFEDYWPAKIIVPQLLTNTKTISVHTPGSWIRVPPPSENPYTAPVPTPAGPPPSMPLWPSTNQMNIAFMQQQNDTPTNNRVIHTSSSSLIQTYLKSVPIGHFESCNTLPMSHTTMHNFVNNNPTHLNQVWNLYGVQCSNNVDHVQQQQQIINQSQQSYGSQLLKEESAHIRTIKTQQCNVLTNHSEFLNTPVSEIIDLTSPPSSPTSQNDSSQASSNPWTLKRVPEYTTQWVETSSPYKISKVILQGKDFYCINAKAFVYSDLMLTLKDLVQTVFPTSTVACCAQILQNNLKTTLYSGNSEQIMVLRYNGHLRSLNPDDTPLAMLQDIRHVFLQLKSLMAKRDEDEETQSCLINGLSKRLRQS